MTAFDIAAVLVLVSFAFGLVMDHVLKLPTTVGAPACASGH